MSDEERRPVRVAHEVFDRLDAILGSVRGPDGRPSTNDFLTFEIIEIIEVFANRFDALPRLIDQRSDYRILINRGTIVYAYAAIGQLRPHGAVEIVRIDVDFGS